MILAVTENLLLAATYVGSMVDDAEGFDNEHVKRASKLSLYTGTETSVRRKLFEV